MDDRQLDLTETQKATKSKPGSYSRRANSLLGRFIGGSFEQCAMGMFGYMTDTETVEPIDTVDVESEGEDMESLLFHFLDDWLYKFSADLFFIPRFYPSLIKGGGEEFSLEKHPQGTEVKAITYSAMQIHDKEKPEIFAIIDI